MVRYECRLNCPITRRLFSLLKLRGDQLLNIHTRYFGLCYDGMITWRAVREGRLSAASHFVVVCLGGQWAIFIGTFLT